MEIDEAEVKYYKQHNENNNHFFTTFSKLIPNYGRGEANGKVGVGVLEEPLLQEESSNFHSLVAIV